MQISIRFYARFVLLLCALFCCVNLLRKALFPPACMYRFSSSTSSCAWNEHLPKAAATAHLDAHSSSLDIEVVDKRNGNKVRARRCRPIPFSLPSIYAKLIFQYVSIICLVRDVSNCSRFAQRNFLPPCANFPSSFLIADISRLSKSPSPPPSHGK